MIEIQNVIALARLRRWTNVVTSPEHRAPAPGHTDISYTRGDQHLTIEFIPATGVIAATTYWDEFEDIPTRKEAGHAQVVEIMESVEDPWGLNED